MFVEPKNAFIPHHTDVVTSVRVPEGCFLLMKVPMFDIRNVSALEKTSLMLTRGKVENAVNVPYVVKDTRKVNSLLLEASKAFSGKTLDPISEQKLDAQTKEDLCIKEVLMSICEYKSARTDYLIYCKETNSVSYASSSDSVTPEEIELNEISQN